MSQPLVCPKCGAQLPGDAPAGLCPKCLVRAGFQSEGQAEPQMERTAPSPASSRFEPPSVEELARRFPQLEVLELLGKGGMGAVYKARQRELDRLVAVKILPPEVARDPTFAERFTREARALARLSHPNIVAVYDFGRTSNLPSPSGRGAVGEGAGGQGVGGESDFGRTSNLPSPSGRGAGGEGIEREASLFYFIMEYVDGVNLRQAIESGGVLPKEALAIVPQICDALQFAHDEGIVHRDIKPENILVDKRGRVKIADFGLAKLLGHAPGDLSLTGTQQVMGTLRYMAPEQIEGTKVVDHRADIYSLGVVFYELLTGELPIGRFAPPSKKVEIDVRLDEVVLRALEKDPEQRYQHVSEVKTEVQAIVTSDRLVGGGIAQVGESRLTSWYFKQSELARRCIKAALILVAVAGICAFLNYRPSQKNLGEGKVHDLVQIGWWDPWYEYETATGGGHAFKLSAWTGSFLLGVVGVLSAYVWIRIYLSEKRRSAPSSAAVVEVRPGRGSPWRRLRLLVTLIVWTSVVLGAIGSLGPLIWNDWWPWAFKEKYEYQLLPQSHAYKELRLCCERRLYCWGQHQERFMYKMPWTVTAEIGPGEPGTRATLELDPFLEQWRWAPAVDQTTSSQLEPRPDFVAKWMKAAGIDVSQPGVLEEAAALIGLMKAAANGVAPGGKQPGDYEALSHGDIKIGPFTGRCGLRTGIYLAEGEGAVGPVDRLFVYIALSLAILLPGIVIIVRRHRRRLAAAHETEQRYRLGTIGFWATLICFLGTMASFMPWVALSSSFGGYQGTGGGFTSWYGTVSVLAFLTVLVLCFLTDFFSVRRSWQPRAMVIAGAIVIIATGVLFWRLTGPPATVRVAKIQFHDYPQMIVLVNTVGCWQEYEYGRGAFSEGTVPKTLEQRSMPALHVALGLGIVLLVLGGVSIHRARRRPAESPGPAREKEPRRLAAGRLSTQGKPVAGAPVQALPPAAPADESPQGRRDLRLRVLLLVKLALWTVLLGVFLWLLPWVFGDRLPWVRNDCWGISLKPQSGAYERLRLYAERRSYGWLQCSGGGPIPRRAWTATATIERLPVLYASAKLELDSHVQQWRFTCPAGFTDQLENEPSAQFVAQRIEATGIDFSKPGTEEEIAAMIGFLKEAVRGVIPGGKHPKDWKNADLGTKIGPFTRGGTDTWVITRDEALGAVYPESFAPVLLAIWLPGVLIIARRPVWRVVTALKTVRGTVLVAMAVWIVAGLIAALVLAATLDDYVRNAAIPARSLGGVLVMVVSAVTALSPIVLILARRRFSAWSQTRQLLYGVLAPVGFLTLIAVFMIVGLRSKTPILPLPVTPTVALRLDGDSIRIDVQPDLATNGGSLGPGGDANAFEYECFVGYIPGSSWPLRQFVYWGPNAPKQSLVKLSATSTVNQGKRQITVSFTNSETVDFDVSGLSAVEVTVDGTPVDTPVRIRPDTHEIVISDRR